jgi:hypothetical protein
VQVEASRKLLCAIYVQPYLIEDVPELLTFVRLADFYFCLPVASGTLSGPLLGSAMFKRLDSYPNDDDNDFFHAPGELIFAAKQLRHPVPFRECLILVVAKSHDPEFIWMEDYPPSLRDDKDIWLLLNKAKFALRQIIIEAQDVALAALLEGHLPSDPHTLAREKLCERDDTFFRYLLERKEDIYHHQGKLVYMFSTIEMLLRNNLVLDQTSYGAVEGLYETCFLSAEIAEKDMPWEVTESDW